MSAFDMDMPLTGVWDQCSYTLPSPPPSELSSPALSVAMLKQRLTPEHDVCMPTSQVFDISDTSSTIQTPIEPLNEDNEPSSPPPAKKSRTTTKDFVPPDVTGLSKREARLVKNRAAAFLSRQRKREEFETMEVRVAQLEQENARLLAMTQSSSAADPNSYYHSEIENLRSQLAAAQAREMQLNSQLAHQSRAASPVKPEPEEPSLPSSVTLKSLANQLPNKSGASFGLMVLLCALPSLLSMQAQSSMPNTFSIPNSLSASSQSFDFSSLTPTDFDWNHPVSQSSEQQRQQSLSFPSTQKLEFMDADIPTGLAGLDVSFDTSALPDGKIRVKIHHPAAQGADLSPAASADWLEAAPPASSDPFFGLGPHYAMDTTSGTPPRAYSPSIAGDLNYDLSYNYDLGSDYSLGTTQGARRRVRIALKSLPASGGEGGEWEVQLC